MSYYYLTIIEKEPSSNEKFTSIRALPNRNGREFQTFYIHERSGTDSAQCDWGIIMEPILSWPIVFFCTTLKINWVYCNLLRGKRVSRANSFLLAYVPHMQEWH